MVGLDGLEPSTLRLSGVRSNHLSYKPLPRWSRRNPKGFPINENALSGYVLAKKSDAIRRFQGSALADQQSCRRGCVHLIFPRKEVIQPHLPIRLPCYDLVPITELAFGAALLSVGLATSGALSFRGLTGGVYKAQEHIHRGVADPRLLAIPASCRRIAAYNPN